MAVEMRHSRVAAKALKLVSQRATHGDDATRKAYKTRTRNFPVLILQNGLAQAMGFLLAKAQGGDNGYPQYRDDFLAVFRAADPTLPADPGQLHRTVLEADLSRYRQLTRYALEAAEWLKRIAETAIAGDDT